MASQTNETYRAGADITRGDAAACKKAAAELLAEIGLPKGLFPLEDMQEFGYNREAGFMWLVQGKKKTEHTFKKIKQTVSYAGEVTAFVEHGKLKKIAGVKRPRSSCCGSASWKCTSTSPLPARSPSRLALGCLIPSTQLRLFELGNVKGKVV
ncbi:unnamed protein product [Miscanthus lutarioriparius]|uniref:Uncharacterized protein n=1 Tax=Miscanthus lutarioriparius TaxID=422564 RepID=A0A811N1S4_9POAL|nr:unnamed protein product [Miscanthus lutarioriparius]